MPFTASSSNYKFSQGLGTGSVFEAVNVVVMLMVLTGQEYVEDYP